MENNRIVVTGLGALTPLGKNTELTWANALKGRSGASNITVFNTEKFRTKFACQIENFDANDAIGRKDAKKLDRFAQLALACSDEAITDSNILNFEGLDKQRVGVLISSGIGGLGTLQENLFDFALGDGVPRFNPYFIPKLIPDIAAGYVSMKHNFMGPNFAIVSACASSAHSIIVSSMYLKLGRADIIICGGSESVVTESGIGGFNAMRALSERNDTPQTASRPFDKTRDGFVMGEGAGIMILETLEHAKKRNAKIYSELVGTGSTADAYHMTAPHPEGLGANNVMKEALKEAKIEPSDVDYINVHGTSTPLGDEAELKAIGDVFGEHAYNLSISSTKSMTGHLLGAAGAVESIMCIKSTQENAVPPTINHKVVDETIDPKLDLTLNKSKSKTVHYALNNTFGFGGHNASIIFKKYTE